MIMMSEQEQVQSNFLKSLIHWEEFRDEPIYLDRKQFADINAKMDYGRVEVTNCTFVYELLSSDDCRKAQFGLINGYVIG
jgi:hypothetical protein